MRSQIARHNADAPGAGHAQNGCKITRASIFRKYSFLHARLAAFVHLHIPMHAKAKERWLELCEHAAVEQDRDKLLGLMREISRLLEEKENRLAAPGTVQNIPGGS